MWCCGRLWDSRQVVLGLFLSRPQLLGPHSLHGHTGLRTRSWGLLVKGLGSGMGIFPGRPDITRNFVAMTKDFVPFCTNFEPAMQGVGDGHRSFFQLFFLEKGRCLAYRDIAKKQTSQLTSSRDVDIHTVDHQLPFEDVQVLNVYTFQFKTGKLQSDSNYQETIQIQHQYPTSPHVILQFTVPSLTAAAKIRRLVTLPPTPKSAWWFP